MTKRFMLTAIAGYVLHLFLSVSVTKNFDLKLGERKHPIFQ